MKTEPGWAWDLVAGWAEDRAKKMRKDAAKIAAAYAGGPLSDACKAYAATVGVAAHIVEVDAKQFRRRAEAERRASQPSSEGKEP